MSEVKIHRYPDTTTLMQALASWLGDKTRDNIRHHAPWSSWALSGGHTPIPLFRMLRDGAGDIPWPHVQLYLVDERDVYLEDPLSNFRMIRKTLLSGLNPPPSRVFPWTPLVPAPQSLALYRSALASLDQNDGFPVLDIAVLGLGSDGHTASLFPDSPQLSSHDWVAYGPGPNAARFTLTLPLLTHARHIIFLATGPDKASRVRECIRDPASDLPAALVARGASDVHWFLDGDSARDL